MDSSKTETAAQQLSDTGAGGQEGPAAPGGSAGPSSRPAREAPEVGAAVTRMLRALARRAGDGELEALEELAQLERQVQAQLGAAVAGYREFQPAHNAAPYSWADVGRILGTTRQAAQQRFRHATVAPAWPRCPHGRSEASRRDNPCPAGLTACLVS